MKAKDREREGENRSSDSHIKPEKARSAGVRHHVQGWEGKRR